MKCNNCDKTAIYHLEIEQELNSVVTNFVLNSVFQHVGLLWIIENNNHYKFEMNLEDTQWMEKGSWYNKTI